MSREDRERNALALTRIARAARSNVQANGGSFNNQEEAADRAFRMATLGYSRPLPLNQGHRALGRGRQNLNAEPAPSTSREPAPSTSRGPAAPSISSSESHYGYNGEFVGDEYDDDLYDAETEGEYGGYDVDGFELEEEEDEGDLEDDQETRREAEREAQAREREAEQQAQHAQDLRACADRRQRDIANRDNRTNRRLRRTRAQVLAEDREAQNLQAKANEARRAKNRRLRDEEILEKADHPDLRGNAKHGRGDQTRQPATRGVGRGHPAAACARAQAHAKARTQVRARSQG